MRKQCEVLEKQYSNMKKREEGKTGIKKVKGKKKMGKKRVQRSSKNSLCF